MIFLFFFIITFILENHYLHDIIYSSTVNTHNIHIFSSRHSNGEVGAFITPYIDDVQERCTHGCSVPLHIPCPFRCNPRICPALVELIDSYPPGTKERELYKHIAWNKHKSIGWLLNYCLTNSSLRRWIESMID